VNSFEVDGGLPRKQLGQLPSIATPPLNDRYWESWLTHWTAGPGRQAPDVGMSLATWCFRPSVDLCGRQLPSGPIILSHR
jgi:hypothetical protein